MAASPKTKPNDIRVGGGFVEIYAKDGVSGVLDDIKRRVTGFAAWVKRAGLAVGGVGGLLGSGPAALFAGGFNRAAGTAAMADQFRLPIDVMNRLQYAAEQAKVSVGEVMGDTTGRFRELIARAPALDPQAARNALRTQQEFRDATLSLQNAMLGLAHFVTPVVRAVAAFVKENAAGVAVVAVLAAGLVGVGVAMTALAAGWTGFVTVLVAGAKIAAATFVALKAVLASGLIPEILVLAGIGYLLVRLFGSDLAAAFGRMASDAVGAWGGIVAALKKNDLQQAGLIAFQTLKVGWAEMCLFFTEKWVDFKNAFLDGWRDAVAWVAGKIGWLMDQLGAAADWLDEVTGGTPTPRPPLAAWIGADRDAERERDRALRQKQIEAARRAVEDARSVLGGLIGAAVSLPGAGSPSNARFMPFEAVKGAFNIASAGQQFGYGDKATADERSRQMAAHVAQCARALTQILPALLTLK